MFLFESLNYSPYLHLGKSAESPATDRVSRFDYTISYSWSARPPICQAKRSLRHCRSIQSTFEMWHLSLQFMFCSLRSVFSAPCFSSNLTQSPYPEQLSQSLPHVSDLSAAKDWLRRGEGHVVQVSSVQGFFGLPGRTAYAAAKHAAIGFYDSLRAEVADRGGGD